MTKSCAECGNKIPLRVKIDDKYRNLQNRTKCLNCLPFGSSPYSTESKKTKQNKKQKTFSDKFKNAYGVYPTDVRKISRRYYLTSVLTNGCQICGYNKSQRNLVFHHLGDKELHLSSREFNYGWNKLKHELQKCCVVCHNCHGEIHDGSIDPKIVCELSNEYKLKLNTLHDFDSWNQFLDNEKCLEIFSNLKKTNLIE